MAPQAKVMPKASVQARSVRCAIYTRKSSEEGLDQDFNSLDAQREACEAFIHSQKSQGWICLSQMYDDGGLSGGTMQRPALAELLAEVEAGKVDTVVVYKVDRLTRSLSDFMKIVEILDRAGASFVSITQQFNTTTSMGRLTLNMLLSFAQFEREVTGERIRDKIAASKKKGMWMGGLAPLGYDARDRKLVVNKSEAETVVNIYRRYLELGSVRLLKEALDRDGVRSKARTDRHGAVIGAKPFSRGALYLMLQNPIYRGEVVHKQQRYPGQHEAIIEDGLWNKVQAMLSANRVGNKTGVGIKQPSLLAGLVYDGAGDRMTPIQGSKKSKLYRYYVSRSLITKIRRQAPHALRVPAVDLEQLIIDRLRRFLRDAAQVHAALKSYIREAGDWKRVVARALKIADSWSELEQTGKRQILLALVDRICVTAERIEIRLRRSGLVEVLGQPTGESPPGACRQEDETAVVLDIATKLRRTGTQTKLLIQGGSAERRGTPDLGLVRLIARAHRFKEGFLRGGRSISELAKEADVTRSYFTRALRLGFLSPQLTRAILRGDHAPELTANKLMTDTRLSVRWEDQLAVLEPSQSTAK